MTRWLLTIIFALIINHLSIAQDLERVKQTIEKLCSEKMSGRGYVKRGDKIAAKYLEEEFIQIGLKPFTSNYLQFFKLDINTFPNQIFLKIAKRKLKVGKDYIVNSISKDGHGRGKVIFLDTLIFKDKKRQADFLKSKIENKVLVFSSKDYNKMIDLPELVLDKIYAAEALIELKDSKLTASLSTRQLSNPIFEILRSDFDSLLLKANPKRKLKARFKVDAEFMKGYLSQNVIGYIQGKSQSDSFLVISAHYDHLGKMGKRTYFPGANDNASGIAMLLELARHYAQPENQPHHSIAFIAFGAEEAGLIGSKFYTEFPLFPLENIRFLFNLDLVGTGDDGATIVNGAIFKKEFELIQKINEKNQYLPLINKRGFAANSDHYFFTERKVPSFFLYTLGGIKAYHDIYDRPETLPLTRFKEVFGLIRDFMNELSLKSF